MTEREKWEAGLWYDANYTPELCAEREKAEELYTEFNQTRPSEKAKRAELLRQLLPHMEEHVFILPHLYVDYGYHCFIGAGTYINHGAYLMDCAKSHWAGTASSAPTAACTLPSTPCCRKSATAALRPQPPSHWGTTSGWAVMSPSCPGSPSAPTRSSVQAAWSQRIFPPAWWPWATPVRCCGLSPKKTASDIRNNCNNKTRNR